MPTPDELRDVQLEYANADRSFREGLLGLHPDTVEDHKGVIATAERAVANGEAGAANAATHAKAAKERVERIEGGETVEGGFRKPLTRKEAEDAAWRAFHRLGR